MVPLIDDYIIYIDIDWGFGVLGFWGFGDGKSTLRPKDKITIERATRSGGDEFIVHVENVSIATGVAIATRILDSIRKQKISSHFQGDDSMKEKLGKIMLSASLGVGYTEKEADEAMYKAKQKGRNRVEFINKQLKAA